MGVLTLRSIVPLDREVCSNLVSAEACYCGPITDNSALLRQPRELALSNYTNSSLNFRDKQTMHVTKLMPAWAAAAQLGTEKE
jgi:hypothetical protein